MMNKTTISLSLCACFAIPAVMTAQETLREVMADKRIDLRRDGDRKQMVTKLQAVEKKLQARARAKARALGLEMRIAKADGNVMEIIDFKGDEPVYACTRNANAAISTGANLVQASPYSLDGTGLMVGIWDAGSVRATHEEFNNGNRVTAVDGSAADNHATHVGGTLAAQGTRPSAKGMAPNALIRSYNWGSYISEMTAAAASLPSQLETKIYVSNHSWGFDQGWRGSTWSGNGTDQNAAEFEFGQYETTARDLDSNLHSTPYHLAFWAIGNDSQDNPSTGETVTIGGISVAYNPAIHPPGDGSYRNGFDNIMAHGLAKNIVSVGSVNDAVRNGVRDPSMAGFHGISSGGPTDDGRIKPDLVANGVSLSSSEAASDSDYGTLSGTSMASPNAAGSALLVIDQYKRLFNSAMRASTLKGLLLHTATDLGNPGPDYKHGWGLMDTKKAVDLVRDHHANPTKNRLTENELTSAVTTRTVTFLWDGGSPLSATLCWSDPAGVANTAHDSRTPTLVNNLNLKLIAPNGSEYYPYVMPFVGTWTVASMNEHATYGINNTDNVETVHIPNPGQLGTWTAEVTYSGALTGASQPYGLLVSGATDTPNVVQILAPTGGETFEQRATYNIRWNSNAAGSISIMLLKGGVYHSMLTTDTPNDGSFSWTVPDTLVLGNDYTIRVRNVPTATIISNSGNITIGQNPWGFIGDAVENTNLLWSSGGTAPWFSQTTTIRDGVDALQSGAIPNSASSSVSTTLVGPGTLTFWTRVSSEFLYDYLHFYLNGVENAGVFAKRSGEGAWAQRSVAIPAGTNSVEWRYKKDGIEAVGQDAAWLDQVVYTPSTRPGIILERVVDIALNDGNTLQHFGSVALSNSSSPMTYTIRNTGTANLTGLALSKTGNAQADFTLGALGATTLAPNASTSFTVTFSPSSTGPRIARLAIASNDSVAGAFDIDLIGTAVSSSLAVSPAASFTSAGSVGGAFSPASTTYTLANATSTAFNWTASKTAAWVTLSATSGTLAAGASTTVTASINSNANSLIIGSYSDTVTFTNTTNGSGTTTRGISLTVNPLAASVSLSNLAQTYDGSTKPITVTTTPSGLANSVTYAGSATVPTNAGTYAVVATVTAPGFTGSASGSLVISKASQTINFAALDTVFDNAAPFALTATATSGLAVSYASLNSSVATISGNTITIVGPGTSTITATQAGDINFNAATAVPQTLTVVRSNPLAVSGGTYKVLIGQSLSLNGSASLSSHGQTLSAYEWDLNNDSNFADVSGVTPSAIGFATLTSTWGMAQGLNTIQLRVTDSSNKTSIVSTTVELITSLTWDANGTTATQTNGAGAWLNPNIWWDGAANQTWSSGASAVFGGPNTAGGAVTLASPTTVNAITFNQFTGTYTLGTAGQSLTVNGGMTMNSTAAAVTFVSPITLGATQTWTNNSASLLTLSGAPTIGTQTLIFAGSGTSTLGAVAITGTTGSITKSGSGVLDVRQVTPAPTYSGATTVSGGVLRIGGNLSASSNLVLNGGVIESHFNTAFTRALGTGAGQVQLTSGASGFSENADASTVTLGGGAITWGGAATFNPSSLVLGASTAQANNVRNSTLTFANAINLNGSNRTVTVNQFDGANGTNTSQRVGNGSIMSGNLTNSTGTAGLIKTGGGRLSLSGTNTYNGGTTISGGTLRFPSLVAMPATGSIAVENGTVLGVSVGSSGQWTTGTSGNGTIGGLLSGLGGRTDSTVTYAGNVGLELNNSSNQTYAGNIANVGTSLGLIKSGAGILTVSGTNTYTGISRIFAGTLQFANRTSLYNATPVSWTAANLNAQSGSTLAFNLGGAGEFTTSDVTTLLTNLAAASSLSNGMNAGSNFGFDTTNASSAFTINDVIANSTGTHGGALGFTKLGTGSLILSNANTYSGNTNVNAGKLFINGSLSNVNASLTVANGATLGGTGTVGRNITLSGSGRLEFDISTNAASHNSLETGSSRIMNLNTTAVLTITSAGGASPGTYTLVTGGGNIAGSIPPTLNLPAHWNATVSISGNSLLLNVTKTPTPYEIWASAQGLSGGNLLSTANPENDHLTNLQEFAYGANPNGITGLLSYTAGGAVTTAGRPLIHNFAVAPAVEYRAVFVRRKDHVAAGLTYTVQFSADLNVWVNSSDTPTVLTGAAGANPSDVEAVSVPFPALIPVAATFVRPTFFRIVIDQTP